MTTSPETRPGIATGRLSASVPPHVMAHDDKVVEREPFDQVRDRGAQRLDREQRFVNRLVGPPEPRQVGGDDAVAGGGEARDQCGGTGSSRWGGHAGRERFRASPRLRRFVDVVDAHAGEPCYVVEPMGGRKGSQEARRSAIPACAGRRAWRGQSRSSIHAICMASRIFSLERSGSSTKPGSPTTQRCRSVKAQVDVVRLRVAFLQPDGDVVDIGPFHPPLLSLIPA